MNFYNNSWRSNPNAVYVGRPSKWGNPFKLQDYPRELCLKKFEVYLVSMLKIDPHFLDELKGKDLVCYCPLDLPCHADILMKYANR